MRIIFYYWEKSFADVLFFFYLTQTVPLLGKGILRHENELGRPIGVRPPLTIRLRIWRRIELEFLFMH